jgi:acetylglutamate kinase
VNGTLVLKLGGELLETADQRTRIASALRAVSSHRALVVVHGGGRAIDAELDRRRIAPRKVDGLRVTDEATMAVVTSVLGGQSNTDLVAALVAQGVAAVGLTGVDAGLGRAQLASAHRTTAGEIVDLGLVGDPVDADASLVELLLVHGYVPVIASLGLETGKPRVLNVNADVMACRLASRLRDVDLVIAGTTPGVLDARGDSIASLDPAGIDALIASGTASAGMIAKLTACRQALESGVSTVRIVDGRLFDPSHGVDDAPGTTLALPATAGV